MRIEPGARRPAPARPVRPIATSSATRIAKGLRNASPRRRRRAGRVRRGCRSQVGRSRREGRARADRGVADDFHGMGRGRGDPDRPRGGATSHAAVVARQSQPCVAGCHEHNELQGEARDRQRRHVGGGRPGSASTARPARSSSARCPRSRHDSRTSPSSSAGSAGNCRVWTNADKPEEAALARTLHGAQGIGLCRAPSFREGEPATRSWSRWSATRAKARTAAGQALSDDDDAAVARFEHVFRGPPQRQLEGVFTAIGRAARRHPAHRPATHEFLPNLEDQLVKVTKAGDAATPGRHRAPGPRSRACTSRTRCWACAAVAGPA